MVSMQSKVMTQIEQMASAVGLEAVRSEQFANTGEIYIQQPGKFETLISITYQFQNDHMMVTIKHRGKPLIANRQRGRADSGYITWYMENQDSAHIQEFFAAYNSALYQEKPKPVRKRRSNATTAVANPA